MYGALLWIQLGHRHFARKGNNARLDNCGAPLQLDILLATEMSNYAHLPCSHNEKR